MTSLSLNWHLPKNGLGAQSDGQCYNHAISAYNYIDSEGKESVNLLTFKTSNGMAVYKLTAEGSGVEGMKETAKVSIYTEAGKIMLNQVADEVSVFNGAGQMVAKQANDSEITTSTKGFYVVKATVNGKTTTAKVIL